MKVSGILQTLKRYPLAVACVVLLVLLVALAFIRADVVPELTLLETERGSRIRTIEENTRRSQGLAAETTRLESYVDALKERLFVREQRAINTNFFYSLEDAVDVVISNVNQQAGEDPALSAGGPKALKLHSTIVYDITVNGAFEEILKFVHQLDQVEPMIRVSDFQLSEANARESSGGSLSAKLRVLVLASRD